MTPNNVKEISAGSASGRAWLVWGMVTVFVIYLFNMQTGYAVLNANIQAELRLSLREISIIASIYTWVFAVCQFFGGPLLDRLGARKVIIPAIALVALGAYTFAVAASFTMLALSQFVLALGACVGFVGAGYVGGKWFGMAKYGVMFGLVQSVVSFSSAFGQAGISLALHEVSWRHLLIDATWFGGALFLLALVLLKDPAPVAGASGNFAGDLFSSLLAVMRIRHVWAAAFWGAASFGTQLALGVIWGPKLFMAGGLTRQMADLCSSTVWIGLGLGCLFWNSWSDRIRSRKLPALTGLALQIAMLLVILFVPIGRPTLNLLIMAMLGLGSSGHMIAFSTAADVVSPEHIGTSASFVNGAMFIMGGVLVAIPGRLLPSTITSIADCRTAFMPLLAILVAALVMAALQRETYPKG